VTVYWVVWDAAANWIVDRLDAEGALPAVRALRTGGARAAGRPPTPNCQTPPSLATLFTGTSTREHGVTGFTVPDGKVFGAHRSGFGAEFPARPPIWRVLGDHGLRSAFVHTPWVFDDSGHVGPYVDAAIEAYNGRLAMHEVLAGDGDWPVGGFPVRVDGSVLHAGGVAHELTPAGGWVPVRLDPRTGFWVRYLGDRLVRTGTWQVRVGGTNAPLVRDLADTPVFAGIGVGSLYREGLFGPRLVDGGDGGAEREFMSSVDCIVRSFSAAVTAVLSRHNADLVVIYLPWTDDVGHEMLGWCDPRSGAYRPDATEQVWPYLRQCYQDADRVLGQVLGRAGDQDTVLLCADHGMVGSTHLLHVNEILIEAGLAERADDGGLDLVRSTVVYHPANNGQLVVNSDLVAPGLTESVLAKAKDALRDYVTGFLDGCYLVLRDDWQPSDVVDGGKVLRPLVKSGSHVVNTGDGRLHATFAVKGPGIPPGVDLGVVDNSLGARVASHQLGVGERPDLSAAHDIRGGRPR
jgi:hypothetical protein